MVSTQIDSITCQYLNAFRPKVFDPNLITQFKLGESSFTRKRKLLFPSLVGLLLNRTHYNLTVRTNFASEILFPDDPDKWLSTCAVVRARKKLNPLVYERLMDYSNQLFYEEQAMNFKPKLWHGYYLLAIDGTRLDIPDTAENRSKFTLIKSNHLPEGVLQGTISMLYDTLNQLPLHFTLGPVIAEKWPVLTDHLPFLCNHSFRPFQMQSIFMGDRAYLDYALLAQCLQSAVKFCIRSKSRSTFKAITQFAQSDLNDACITVQASKPQRKWLEAEGLPLQITVRAVKVPLNTGETEILITNLFDQSQFPTSIFPGLYNLRWPIEGCFNVLKNIQRIEKFSSKQLLFIKQDLYAQIFVYTLCEMLKKEEDRRLAEDQGISKRKLHYQVGIALDEISVNQHVFELIAKPDLNIPRIYQKYLTWVRSQLSPIRPDRHFDHPHRSDSQLLVGRITTKREYA